MAGKTAVIIEEARCSEIAPLIAQAYALSSRERELTRLILRALSTGEIAAELHLSPNTVQDYLKAVFDKVGVRSRRELVASIGSHQLWDANKRSATPSGFRDPFIANLTDARNRASASPRPDYWPTVSS